MWDYECRNILYQQIYQQICVLRWFSHDLSDHIFRPWVSGWRKLELVQLQRYGRNRKRPMVSHMRRMPHYLVNSKFWNWPRDIRGPAWAIQWLRRQVHGGPCSRTGASRRVFMPEGKLALVSLTPLDDWCQKRQRRNLAVLPMSLTSALSWIRIQTSNNCWFHGSNYCFHGI